MTLNISLSFEIKIMRLAVVGMVYCALAESNFLVYGVGLEDGVPGEEKSSEEKPASEKEKVAGDAG